ncbi:MAG TPA: prepilin-type cleavage/methylation domain-containing protein, partial [Gammaproteobacteria bacterium]|nr:prepilin-type cleavage/methylation domain-containing protein [Gammaproteobacteria bacterium]
MITITLGAIIMGIGVPSYQDFVVKNRIQTQASEIRSSL